jgi:hypothetical protein
VAAEDGLTNTKSIEALTELRHHGAAHPVEAMGWFWNALHEVALDDLEACADGAVVVSHEELAGSVPTAARRLAGLLGLAWSDTAEHKLSGGALPVVPITTNLHDFERPPAVVASEWRSKLAPGEIEVIEEITAPVRERLEARRLRLSADGTGQMP